jgi:hypothetical protein
LLRFVAVSRTVIETARFVKPAEKIQKWPSWEQASRALTVTSTLLASRNQK